MRFIGVIVVVVAGCSSAPATVVAPQPQVVARATDALPFGVIATGEESPSAIAVDGGTVYWLAGGKLRAVATTGGAPRTLVATDAGDLEVDGGRVYLLGERLSTWTAGDAAPRELAAGGWKLALGRDHVFVADDNRLVAVPRAGGEPRELAIDVDASAVAADATHVYWADHGVPPPSPGGGRDRGVLIGKDGKPVDIPPDKPRLGAIRRVAIAGGAVETLVDGLFYPTDVAVVGDHVYWSNHGGDAVMRAAIADRKPRVMLRGRGVALAADARGVAVRTTTGMIAEVPLDRTLPFVRSLAVATRSWDGDLAIDDRAIYAIDAGGQIVRFDRGDGRVRIVATPRRRLGPLALDGESVVYVDGGEIGRQIVMRVKRSGGAPLEVMRVPEYALRIAAGGGHVLTGGHDGLVRDGKLVVENVSVNGIAANATGAWYIAGGTVYALRHDATTPIIIHQPDGFGVSVSVGGPPPADDVWLEATHVHVGAYYLIRAPLGGGRVDTIKDEGVVAAAAIRGSAESVIVDERGIVHVSSDRVLLATTAEPDDLVADRANAYTILRHDDGENDLIRIPLAGGTPATIVRGLYEPAAMALDDHGAIFIALAGHAAIIRIDP